MEKQLTSDIGNDLQEEFQDAFNSLKSYYPYTCSSKSIIFDESALVVGSEEWGVAASDVGGEWTWTSFPNIDNLKEWVRTYKDGGAHMSASERKVTSIAMKVGKKIYRDGLDEEGNYWVDESLMYFVETAGDSGSGRQ